MKTLNQTLQALLTILNDCQFHSGPVLAKSLNISRAAVSKQLKQLDNLGIAVQSCRQQGYRLRAPFYPLQADAIRLACEPQLRQTLDLHIYAELNSTNDYLKTLNQPGINVCVSEQQTAGRGRLGRTWHSPFGSNIYCSFKWPFEGDISALSGLSLIVGLALIDAIHKEGTDDLTIKWPNDIFLQGKKLAGVLIDIQAEPHGRADVIIGFGINVNMQGEQAIDAPWIGLSQFTGRVYDRNQLIGLCLSSLTSYIERFTREGLSSFNEQWLRYDLLAGQEIALHTHSETVRGVACGIDDQGRLKLQDRFGNITSYSSGDASLHSRDNNSLRS